MRILGLATIGAALALSQAASAACDYPGKVTIPDGASATKDEMLEGQRAIKTYMDAMNTYLDCIENETSAAGAPDESAEMAAEREALLAKRHNAAVEEMELLAARFNEQVRAYKQRSE